MCRFVAVPLSKDVTLCLCDLKDDRVQQILDRPVSVTACAQSTGWLTDEEQKLVQQVVKERLDALFEQSHA